MPQTSLQIVATSWKAPDDLRPPVAVFARLMEHIVRDNDHKGGWAGCDLLWLFTKLAEECGELAQEMGRLHAPSGERLDLPGSADAHKQRTLHAIRECVDIANLAMMLAENLSAQLGVTQEAASPPAKGAASLTHGEPSEPATWSYRGPATVGVYGGGLLSLRMDGPFPQGPPDGGRLQVRLEIGDKLEEIEGGNL